MRPHTNSGANFIASEADFDAFSQQVTDASAFLQENSGPIAEMVGFPGVEKVTLDFAVCLYENSAAVSAYLPPAFVRLAAQLGVGIEVTHYACSEEPAAEG